MKKLIIVGIIILLGIVVVSSKVSKLERSPLCDRYRVSISAPLYIPEYCIKSGK